MANRYGTKKTLSNQTRLPPIRGRCGTSQNPISLVSEDEYSSLISSLPRPRVESRSIVNGKAGTAPLSFQDAEKKQKSSKSFETIDTNFLPLRQPAAKHGTGSLEKAKGSRGARRHEETYAQSGAHRIDGTYGGGGRGFYDNTMTNPSAEKLFQRPVKLLRRRLKPCKAYQQSDDHQMSREELLSLERKMDQIHAFTERDKMIEVKDFNGQKIDPKKTGNSDITSYIAMFEVQNRACNGSEAKNYPPTGKTSSDKETDVRVRGRFYEALDNHFYHYYRNTHPQRRMAICEEIERTIIVDDLPLTCFREHLSLQDVMNTWMM